jgi:DnaK suppressor protein
MPLDEDDMTTTHGLTRRQLTDLRTDLLSERVRLERSLSAELERGESTVMGFAPRGPTDVAGGVALTLETRTHARYAAILDALTRLAAGTYGICVSCKNRIPYGRLVVMPEATRCVACGARV